MASRMLCTDCFETSHPQTLLAGSDRIEMVAWLCFALPGWLYCWWRHMLRIKVCGVCGGSSLVREARVAAANDLDGRNAAAALSFGRTVYVGMAVAKRLIVRLLAETARPAHPGRVARRRQECARWRACAMARSGATS